MGLDSLGHSVSEEVDESDSDDPKIWSEQQLGAQGSVKGQTYVLCVEKQ